MYIYPHVHTHPHTHTHTYTKIPAARVLSAAVQEEEPAEGLLGAGGGREGGGERWAEGRTGEEDEGREERERERQGGGGAQRFWQRVTNVWPLENWFKYDGCKVLKYLLSLGTTISNLLS